MTVSNQPVETLQQQIETFQAQLATQLPPEMLAELANSSAALIQTGIAQQSLKTGEQAPDFTLPDVFGNAVTLSELLKHGPVVVTFYRGEWCPYCNFQLRVSLGVLYWHPPLPSPARWYRPDDPPRAAARTAPTPAALPWPYGDVSCPTSSSAILTSRLSRHCNASSRAPALKRREHAS